MTNTMFIINRNDLAKKVAEKKGFTKAQANEIVKDVFAIITEELEKGNQVSITGFGKFEVKEHSGREGVNPVTHEKMTIASSLLPTFKASGTLKALINNND